MNSKNIFIVGCARSGTSLLRQILNQSSQISICPETHYLHRLSSVGRRAMQMQKLGELTDDDNVERFVARIYEGQKISTYWQWLRNNYDRQIFKQRLLETDRSERAIFSLLMRLFAEERKGGDVDSLILGEKTPAHLYYVPTLLGWFPQAKIIHTFRDPRAIAASRIKKVKQLNIGLRLIFPSAPEWLLDPFDTPVEVAHMSRDWFEAAQLHASYEKQFPENYKMIRFEDLVVEPTQQIEQVCAFLETPVESAMLDEVVVVGSSYESQQRGPSGFDTRALERWKENLNPLARAWFSIWGRKHLKRFGYPL